MFRKGKKMTIQDDDDQQNESTFNQQLPSQPQHQLKPQSLQQYINSKSKSKSNGFGRLKKTCQCLCGICLSVIQKSTMTLLTPCNHQFCYDCLIEWSKTDNHCPFCRQTFSQITLNGEQIQLVFVKNSCQICNLVEPVEDMIQCRNCESLFCHFACLNRSSSRSSKANKSNSSLCRKCQDEGSLYDPSFVQSSQGDGSYMSMSQFIVQDEYYE